MIHRLFTIASAVSLLLCVASVVLWARSCNREDHLSWLDDGERHTLRSSKGRLTMFVPPTGIGTPDVQETLARQILKNGAGRTIRCASRDGAMLSKGGYVTAEGWDPYPDTASPPLLQMVSPLLRALENPATALTAHVALSLRSGMGNNVDTPPQTVGIGGTCRALFAGAEVVLQPKRQFTPKSYWVMYESTAQLDPASIPTVRDWWHRRLDIPRWSLDYRLLTAAFAILPLTLAVLQFRRAFQGYIRNLRHQCASCGYDLRASLNQCPECGTPSRS